MAVQHSSAPTLCPWSLSASCCETLDEEVTRCERERDQMLAPRR